MAAYKIAALQRALDDSVPSSDLEKANKQYTDLTVKYRNMLQRDSRLIQRTTNLEHLEVLKKTFADQVCPTSHVVFLTNDNILLIFFFLASQSENESLREQISAMNKELEITKEKLNTLEQRWENIPSTGKLRIVIITNSFVCNEIHHIMM